MRLFSKPRPILTLSKGFYMTVFSTTPIMPPIIDVIHPRRMSHAVVGMGAPLKGHADPESLAEPMKTGPYALVTMNRKTVIKTLVMPIDECDIDINAIAAEQAAIGVDFEALSRLRAAWFVTQFSFESYDPQIFASIRFLYRLTDRLAELTNGIIADPLAQRYVMPGSLFRESYDEDPLHPHELISIAELPGKDGPRLRTLGMAKFDHPDFAVELPHQDHLQSGQVLLTETVKSMLHGRAAHLSLGSDFLGEIIQEEPEIMVLKHKHPHTDFISAYAAWHRSRSTKES